MSDDNPYTFTENKDWVTSRVPLWNSLIADIRLSKIRVIEIGCFEGRSTIWWLDNLLCHPESKLLAIDPLPDPQRYARFLNNISQHPRVDQLTFVRNQSRHVLAGQTDDTYDFAYIDGSHEARDVLTDASLAFWKVRAGGIILFDDYSWEGPHHNLYPKPAIDAFLTCFAPWLETIHIGYQVAVRKVPANQ